MKQTQVSIIIPAYNSGAFIERSIGSALAQTHGNVQVVVVDDGSSDDTLERARALAESDGRVLIAAHERNRGRMEARRTGIELATGAFTLFLDADDELHPETAKRLLTEQATWQAGGFDIVQCDFELRYKAYVSPSERRFNRDFNRPPAAMATGDDITHLVFRDRRTTWSLCGKLMRTSLVKEAVAHVEPGTLTQAEDACLFFIISCLARAYKGLPSFVGYVYNIDDGGSDARWRHMDLARFEYSCRYVESMNIIERFLRETGRAEALADDYRTVRREHVRSVADKLIHLVDRADKPAAFDLFCSTWPVDEAIGGMCEAGWDEAADCVEGVASADTLRCPARTVKTVACYHYRMHMGGAERVAATLAGIWREKGYRVVFFADEPRENCVFDLPEGVIWVQLPDSGAADAADFAERARIIAEAVRAHHIDAFVTHQWWNKLLAWDLLLLKTLDVPVCVFCHNIYEVMFMDANPAEFDCSRLFRHADGLVVLSEADLRFWKKFNPRVWQTANPATIEPDAARVSALSGKEVVWVGRLSAWDKQPQEAIEIMARVIAHDPAATLTIVGSTDDARFLRELKSQVRAAGIQDNVNFAGEHADPTPFFQRASMLLLTSRLDGWCLVLAEAQALGVPCVMYEMPYLTLAQGQRGIVAVSQGDREAAARAVIDVLADDGRRAELGKQAFEHACEVASFDLGAFWDNVFDELAKGSVEREGFAQADAEWDLLLDGVKASVAKAADPGIRTYAKRKGLEAARTAWHRLRRR